MITKEQLGKHDKWLASEEGGERLVLSGAKLSWADLSEAKLSEADLSEAELRGADLIMADLSGADLSGADLSGAKLSWAKLSGADLSWADLGGADLSEAKLSEAKLSEADLSGAELSGADLSEATGLIGQTEWMCKNVEACEDGYIVYKSFNNHYKAPGHWVIEVGAEITEVVNPCRVSDCACGVNVAVREWFSSTDGLWRCLIPWDKAAGIVVPYHTDGKFRTEYLKLIELVDEDAR